MVIGTCWEEERLRGSDVSSRVEGRCLAGPGIWGIRGGVGHRLEEAMGSVLEPSPLCVDGFECHRLSTCRSCWAHGVSEVVAVGGLAQGLLGRGTLSLFESLDSIGEGFEGRRERDEEGWWC